MEKKNIFSLLLLLVFIAAGIFFLRGRTDELAKILEVKLSYVIVVFLLIVLNSLINGHKIKLLLNNYGVNLHFHEWWGIQIITLFWNYITPFKGGLPVRAAYLKKKHKFPYTYSVSVTGIAYLTDFLTYGFFGVILSFFLPVTGVLKYSTLIFFTIVFLASAFVMFWLPLPINLNFKFLRHISNSINELQKIRKDYILLFKLALNCIERTIADSLRLYFLFLAFGFSASFYTCIVINLFLGLSMVLSITPLNLGFRESVVVISSKLFGISAILGVFVVTLERAISMIWIFVAAPIFSYILFKSLRLKDKIKKEGYK